jgi:hypothetical protein
MEIDPVNFQPIELSYYFFVGVSIIYTVQYVENSIIKCVMIVMFSIILIVHYNRYQELNRFILHKSDPITTTTYLFGLIGIYSLFVYVTTKMTNRKIKVGLMIFVGMMMGYGMYVTYIEKEQQLMRDYGNVQVVRFSKNIDVPILVMYVILTPFILKNEMIWFTFLIGDMFYHITELFMN